MTTSVRKVSERDLVARRAAILESLHLSAEELAAKVKAGGLVGHEWTAWSELEDIEYLLAND